MDRLGYDETDPASIENYAQGLIGKTFDQICKEDEQSSISIVKESVAYDQAHENKKRKGGLGELIEERFFYYKCNNDARPDFDKAGVELKVTPYKQNKNGRMVAKERLVITMIDYFAAINEDFSESHVWQKARLMLLVYYLYAKQIRNRLDYQINYVKLFSPPKEDVRIIAHDYEVIIEKIRAGKAHELSEGDTLYLGAAPKAATSKDRKKQPCSNMLAKPRAFVLKKSYMTYVLNHFIIPEKDTYEPIVSDVIEVPFEKHVTDKIGAFKGYTVEELCREFKLKYPKKPKNLEAILAFRILGIQGNHAAEFEKANIIVKSIRIGKNNKIKENMSFPNFKFKELVKEEWETSVFRRYLSETRFLFVIYKFYEDGLHLQGCQFWNIPYSDLEVEVRSVWNRTKKVLIEGLKITQKGGKNHDNLPAASENPVCHVRPHAKNAKDTYELPDGRQYAKQCFWLNNSYILKQLDKRFLD